MTVGQRIAQKRKELGLSQEALGEQLGVSRQAIYKWESDATLPEIEKLIALSRIFAVPVGWLLGVEEEPSAPKELTEEQLLMVQEIVDRYLAARSESETNSAASWWPEPESHELSPEQLRLVSAVADRVQANQPPQEPPKRRRWPWIIAAAACLAIIIALFSLSEQLRSLDNQTRYLQSSMQMIENSVATQIGSITDRVEEVLKSQNDLTSDYSTEFVGVIGDGSMGTFSWRARPKTYQPGMVAWVDIENGDSARITYGPYDPIQEVFSGEFTIGLTDSTAIYIVFEYCGIRQSQLLDTYKNLYTHSFPSVYLDIRPLQSQIDDKTNALTEPLEGAVTGLPGEGGFKDLQSVGISSYRLGLFADQELVAWFTPGTHTINYMNDDGTITPVEEEWHTLSPDGIVFDREKVYCIAAVIVDQYGREFVHMDTPTYYQTGEGWTYRGSYRSGPFFEGWTY